MFDRIVSEAARHCIEYGVPFCLYRMPGPDSVVTFFSNPSFGKDCETAGRRFLIGEWLERTDNFACIQEEANAESTMRIIPRERYSLKTTFGYDDSTRREDYISALNGLIADISEKKLGKVVVSSIKVVEADTSPESVVDVASRLFKANPEAFCYLYMTPLNGLWVGATPELMAECDYATRSFNTMALAGTRKRKHEEHLAFGECSGVEDWDEKNREEQRLVKDYIAGTLKGAGYDTSVEPTAVLPTGHLEHLVSRFHGELHKGDTSEAMALIDLLNPTPALCGFPVSEALPLIEGFERHKRLCYGGVVGVESDVNMKAFVNLRCAKIEPRRFVLFGGGGILARSEAEKEWRECEDKMDGLRKLL